MVKSFLCEHCFKKVPVTIFMGTRHRNHCPFCLWSKHVDINSGDRKSSCLGLMEPIGLTFKKERIDKYGNVRKGEIMIVHCCLSCNSYSINRIASDDNLREIMAVFENSLIIDKKKRINLEQKGIKLLTIGDKEELEIQLYGKKDKKCLS